MTNTHHTPNPETRNHGLGRTRLMPTTPRRFSSSLAWVAVATLCACTACGSDPKSPDNEPSDGELPQEPSGAAIDVHTHLASQTVVDLMTGGGVPAADADDLIERLDEANVRRAVVLSAGYFALPDNSNMAPENDWVSEQVEKYPDRLIGFCGINPLFENGADEVDRCLALPGMVGVKIHMDGSRIDMTNMDDVEALSGVFDRVEANDAPILMHVSDKNGQPLEGDGFANLAMVIEEHPTIRIVHAHCAGNIDDESIEWWLRVGNSGYRENSFVDVSACLDYYSDAPLATRELMVWRFRNWGIDRVLFGSDYFKYGQDEAPAEALKTLAQYPFTQEELDTIVHNDASAWLGTTK